MDTSYGWVECAGLADRSAFDLSNHQAASKVDLMAYEQYDTPQQVEVVEVVPQMKVLGKELKKDGKLAAEHLTGLDEQAAMALKVWCIQIMLPCCTACMHARNVVFGTLACQHIGTLLLRAVSIVKGAIIVVNSSMQHSQTYICGAAGQTCRCWQRRHRGRWQDSQHTQ